SSSTATRILSLSIVSGLRKIGADAHGFPLPQAFGKFVELVAHALQAILAEYQIHRWRIGFGNADDCLRGPRRIAGLLAAVAADLGAARSRRFRVGVDRIAHLLQRAAGPVGAERPRFDYGDANAQ